MPKMAMGMGSSGEATAAAVAVGGGFENNYSVAFDGSDDNINCSNGADVDDIFDGASGGTWAAWVYTDTLGGSSGQGRIIDKAKTLLNIQAAGGASGSGDAQLRFLTYYGGYLYWLTDKVVDFDTWHHIAVTYTRAASGTTNNPIIYVDTVAKAATETGTTSGVAVSDEDDSLMIGANSANDCEWDGKIDEVAVWNTTLSASAITAIYNSRTPFDLTADKGDYTSSGNLKGYWRMEEGTGSTVVNTANSGTNNGTVSNAVFSSSVPS